MESSELLVVARQRDVSSSGVSWGAVIAGAFVAAALSLIMLALGAGFGLSAVSPWSNVGASGEAFDSQRGRLLLGQAEFRQEEKQNQKLVMD